MTVGIDVSLGQVAASLVLIAVAIAVRVVGGGPTWRRTSRLRSSAP